MKTKALVVTIIVFVLSLFVGVVGAQEDEAQPNRTRIVRMLGGEVVEIVTESTGLTTADILQQIRDGSTLAEIIADNGGDVDAIIAEVEAEVMSRIETAVEEARITQDTADIFLENLSENLTTFINSTHEMGNRDGGLRNRVQAGVLGSVADAVTEATGLDAIDIMQQLRDGSTLAQIITDNGGDVDTVTATIIDNITTAINERIENGDLTQAQGDTILENLESTLSNWMNGELPQRPNRGQRGNN